LKRTETLYLVDTVTSLGGMEVAMDERGVDILYSGSQKCLSCPPGLAPVSVSDRALDILKNRTSKVPNWYLDLSMLINYWEGRKRVYHHTAPINMVYALYEALFLVIEEGIENVFERHMTNHRRLVKGLEDLGLNLFVTPEARLPMLNSVSVPEGTDEAAVRSRLLNDFHIEIGAGLGPLAGKIWRIGLMGHTARPEHVDRFLDAMKQTLEK
jgi:alanine-glyoxylate transaminase/serine-glyoxylate transaminase/serine-pyruvate transaminase